MKQFLSAAMYDRHLLTIHDANQFTCIFLIYNGFVFLFIDINECNSIPAPCDVNANCKNNEGSYLCSCRVGFIGDGKTCEGIKVMVNK